VWTCYREKQVQQDFSGRNLGITLGRKPKVGAKLCCILPSFFLGYESLLGTNLRSALDFVDLWRGCFSEQNQVQLWTLESFGGVASWNKITFRSRLRRASETLFLGTKLSSALEFGELWRGCFSKQNCVPLWTSQSFGKVAYPNKIAFCSGLWRREFWQEIYHR
jgi:hypothetical protein